MRSFLVPYGSIPPSTLATWWCSGPRRERHPQATGVTTLRTVFLPKIHTLMRCTSLNNYSLILFILFLAALVLFCCMQACSSCGKLLSSCDAWASYCSGFYCFEARALGYTGFSRAATGSTAHGIGNPPRPGVKPMSLAMAG